MDDQLLKFANSSSRLIFQGPSEGFLPVFSSERRWAHRGRSCCCGAGKLRVVVVVDGSYDDDDDYHHQGKRADASKRRHISDLEMQVNQAPFWSKFDTPKDLAPFWSKSLSSSRLSRRSSRYPTIIMIIKRKLTFWSKVCKLLPGWLWARAVSPLKRFENSFLFRILSSYHGDDEKGTPPEKNNVFFGQSLGPLDLGEGGPLPEFFTNW